MGFDDVAIEHQPFSRPLTSDSDMGVLHAALVGVLESFTYSAAIFDHQRRLILANNAFCALMGLPPDRRQGSPYLTGFLKQLNNQPQNGAIFKLQLETTQGLAPYMAALSPFTLYEDQPPGLILSLNAIPDSSLAAEFLQGQTNRSAVAYALKRMQQYAKQAESANQAKSEFLTNMSHEIRTPLNGVLGTINLLLSTDLSEQQRRYAEICRNSSESLMGLLNDILDFSKIESGLLELEDITFSLTSVLEDVAEIITHRLTKRRLQLVYYLEPGCPDMVRGDIGRVRQILVNLAGNAVKFTSEGSVTIKVRLENQTGGDYLLRFEVTDTGIGIPKDKLARLFTPFTQVDASTTRKFGGTGLGLSISKRLAKLMGGNIGATSREGQGSTFWFTIRLGQAPQESACPVKLEGRVLLAAPPHAQTMPQLTLNGFGLDVRPVASLAEAQAALAGPDAFSAVVVDYDLGPAVVKDIAGLARQKPGKSQIILLMPAIVIDAEMNAFKKEGYSGLVTKPVKKSDLLKLFDQSSDQPQCPRPMDLSPESVAQAGKFRLLLVEDNQVNQMVAVGLLKKVGYKVDVAANGQEAVAALSQINYDLVLMDCQMPVMDGYEATALIRCGESPALDMTVPIIAMTANAMLGDKEKCLSVGMNDYLSKPIIPGQLQHILLKWLSKKKDDPVPAPQKTRLKPAWERFAKTRRPV